MNSISFSRLRRCMNDRLWRRATVKSGKGQTMTMGSGRVFSWAGVDEEKSFIQNYIKIWRKF